MSGREPSVQVGEQERAESGRRGLDLGQAGRGPPRPVSHHRGGRSARARERGHGYDDGVYGLAFSPDGATLATGDWTGRVRLWDADTWELIQDPLADGFGRVYAVTFDPSGSVLAAAGFDGRVIVWDAETWERIRELTLEDAVLSLAFDPAGEVIAAGTERGEVIAAGTERGEVQFIDVATGQPIGVGVAGQRDWVNSVTFAPDGRTLVAGSEDGSIVLIASSAWTDDIAVLADELCRVAGRSMTQAEWDEFVDFKPYEPACADFGGS